MRIERDNTALVIKNVPTLVCQKCGNEYVNESVAKNLHEMVDLASGQGTTNTDYLRFARQKRRSELQQLMEQAKQAPELSRRAIWLGCGLSLVFLAVIVLIGYGILWGVPSSVASRMRSIADGRLAFVLPVARYGLIALLTAGLSYPLIWGDSRKYLSFFSQIRLMTILQSVIVLGVVAACGMTLEKYAPFLNRSWLYMLPVADGVSMNIAVLPATVRYLGPVYVLLLMLNLPALAHSEELSYRKDTRNWKHGSLRSLRFGLSHCIVGVPIHYGLALSIGGLWFTYQYFRGGVERSTVYHLCYNLIIIVALAYFVLSR